MLALTDQRVRFFTSCGNAQRLVSTQGPRESHLLHFVLSNRIWEVVKWSPRAVGLLRCLRNADPYLAAGFRQVAVAGFVSSLPQ